MVLITVGSGRNGPHNIADRDQCVGVLYSTEVNAKALQNDEPAKIRRRLIKESQAREKQAITEIDKNIHRNSGHQCCHMDSSTGDNDIMHSI